MRVLRIGMRVNVAMALFWHIWTRKRASLPLNGPKICLNETFANIGESLDPFAAVDALT